ncbi:8251_t:CDS:2, partial [Gigaspora rosea]
MLKADAKPKERILMEALITAGAWISDKSEKSYTWIIEQFVFLIFYDISPFVFVTNNDAALICALRNIFPG